MRVTVAAANTDQETHVERACVLCAWECACVRNICTGCLRREMLLHTGAVLHEPTCVCETRIAEVA